MSVQFQPLVRVLLPNPALGVTGTVACAVFSFLEGVAWKAASAELDSRVAEVLTASSSIPAGGDRAAAYAHACRARLRRLEVLFVVLVEGVV